MFEDFSKVSAQGSVAGLEKALGGGVGSILGEAIRRLDLAEVGARVFRIWGDRSDLGMMTTLSHLVVGQNAPSEHLKNPLRFSHPKKGTLGFNDTPPPRATFLLRRNLSMERCCVPLCGDECRPSS